MRRNRHPADVGRSAISTVYDDTDGIRPTRGQRLTFRQDFAGLGGDVRYVRSRVNATKYKSFGGGWIFSAHAEGGYIEPLQARPARAATPIRLTDRFFGPQLRGFDIRGIGPRVQRVPYNADGTLGHRLKRSIDRRARRQGLLHGPARARVPDRLRRSRAWASAVGLSSMSARCGTSRTPALTDVVSDLHRRRPGRPA